VVRFLEKTHIEITGCRLLISTEIPPEVHQASISPLKLN